MRIDFHQSSDAFFGREKELDQVNRLLEDPHCRLITVWGPGGIGKTRLAIEAASKYQAVSDYESLLVDLQAAETPDRVLDELLQAFRIRAGGQEAALNQLSEFLADTDHLLLLDNFENVLAAAPLIGDLLEQRSGFKLLVTSRAPLRITQEWLVPLDGLPVPQQARLRDPLANPAVRLFHDRVRRLKPEIDLGRELPAIERICRLSGGMPLAIEIAASWAHTRSLSEIAEEMEHDTRFLTSGLRNLPDRHRSIRAIFEHAIGSLDSNERTAFERLSVFPAGFTRDAATEVAGASGAIMETLMERSLVKRDSESRFRLHELIRQFASEELSKSRGEQSLAQTAHSGYFMSFLAKRWATISYMNQRGTASEIEVEYDNIRTAWDVAVKKHETEAVRDAVETMAMFFQFRGRYTEAAELYSRALPEFREDPSPLGQETSALLLVEHGWFSLRLGNIDDAETAFREAIEVRSRYKIPVRGFAVDPELALAYALSTRGDLKSAESLAMDALDRIKAGHIHESHVVIASYLLAHLASRTGDDARAKLYGKAALDACTKAGDHWFVAYCHQALGEVEAMSGNMEEATRHLEASLETSLAFEDPAGVALSHVCLGEFELLRKNLNEAYSHFEQGRDAYLHTGDRGGVVRAEAGLGHSLSGLNDHRTAAQWYASALNVLETIDLDAVFLDVLAGVALLGHSVEASSDAISLISFVTNQESTEQKTRALLESGFPRKELADSTKFDEKEALSIARSILDNVTGNIDRRRRGSNPVESARHLVNVDSLTEREREIVDLIAQGLSNQQIADRLVVSLSTVKWHNYQIFAKLGVTNRTAAVAALSPESTSVKTIPTE